ncbi:hypothetical protein FB45DRAFT_877221 [Roridomyces roridus]|uniref:Uncharacterized protein n=1 Tax=Roridomyces roridus TaxID=1738132 RepID=A0AAD7FA83_9AGAR|nr:hypothetical protein FB45DRAFT_877221 [Roridomyces roridus]
MLFKFLSSTLVLLALTQVVVSSPSLEARTQCSRADTKTGGPDLPPLIVAAVLVVWRGSPTFAVLRMVREGRLWESSELCTELPNSMPESQFNSDGIMAWCPVQLYELGGMPVKLQNSRARKGSPTGCTITAAFAISTGPRVQGREILDPRSELSVTGRSSRRSEGTLEAGGEPWEIVRVIQSTLLYKLALASGLGEKPVPSPRLEPAAMLISRFQYSGAFDMLHLKLVPQLRRTWDYFLLIDY